MLPILEILYHVEDRNSHHVYMALIILLILTEDDAFNRSIHEVVGGNRCTLLTRLAAARLPSVDDRGELPLLSTDASPSRRY